MAHLLRRRLRYLSCGSRGRGAGGGVAAAIGGGLRLGRLGRGAVRGLRAARRALLAAAAPRRRRRLAGRRRLAQAQRRRRRRRLLAARGAAAGLLRQQRLQEGLHVCRRAQAAQLLQQRRVVLPARGRQVERACGGLRGCRGGGACAPLAQAASTHVRARRPACTACSLSHWPEQPPAQRTFSRVLLSRQWRCQVRIRSAATAAAWRLRRPTNVCMGGGHRGVEAWMRAGRAAVLPRVQHPPTQQSEFPWVWNPPAACCSESAGGAGSRAKHGWG